MKRLSIIIAFLIGLFQFASASVTKAEADKDYQENKFADAIEKYEAILASEFIIIWETVIIRIKISLRPY